MQFASALLPSPGKDRLPKCAIYTYLSIRCSEAVADLGLASVDHVIERLIVTVIETCSVGAIVCVSGT